MRRQKGKAVEKWNWQAHESKFGADSDISSEYEIISNYNFSEYSSEEDASMDQSAIRAGVTFGKEKTRGQATKRRGANGRASEYGDF